MRHGNGTTLWDVEGRGGGCLAGVQRPGLYACVHSGPILTYPLRKREKGGKNDLGLLKIASRSVQPVSGAYPS